MRYELCQSFALLPRRPDSWIWISEPSQRRIQKFISGRSASTRPLSVEGPTKNKLCRPIMFSRHSSEPIVNERGLSDTGPGNNCNDVDVLVCPCIVQESDILISPENITSCNGQPRY